MTISKAAYRQFIRELFPRPGDADEWVLRRALERQEKKQGECQHPPSELVWSVIAQKWWCQRCEKFL